LALAFAPAKKLTREEIDHYLEAAPCWRYSSAWDGSGLCGNSTQAAPGERIFSVPG
jgi:hypothetical protein